MANEVTGTALEDGAIEIKDGETPVRYVKESDLLAVKGSREELQKKLEELEKSGKASGDANDEKHKTELATANEAKIKAEAEVERLTEEIKKHTGTAEELAKLRTELETAQNAGKSTATALLEMTRKSIISTYKVAPETVNEKSLDELKVFEDALKAVIGAQGGNYAAGGASGGPGVLKDKSPMELAKIAYASSNK